MATGIGNALRALGPLPGESVLAAALRRERGAIAEYLLQAIRAVESTHFVPPAGGPDAVWIDQELGSLVDVLARYLLTGEDDYAVLFVAQLRWAFRDSPLEPEARAAAREHAAEALRAELVARLGPAVQGEDGSTLGARLDDVAARLAVAPAHPFRVLLVGDCVMADVIDFLETSCARDGIALEPMILGGANPMDLRNQLRSHASARFDAIFYSPFTYDSSLELRDLFQPRTEPLGPEELTDLGERAIAPVRQTLELMTSLWEVPIFVHDASLVERRPTLAAEVRSRRTFATRARVATWVSARMRELVTALNPRAGGKLHLFAESEVVARSGGEEVVGQTLHDTERLHPARYGAIVAEHYRDRVFVLAHLVRKKLVITDLDNTLWDGVIGEGTGVDHFLDRQRALRRLRDRGVVLAVASKNDPRNVSYDGGLLADADFVQQEVSWKPKVLSIERIRDGLNLKTKDFVFVDDRADERGMVSERFPEMQVHDATDPRTWRLYALWADLLPPAEMDRTQMYKEREERSAYLETAATEMEDQAALYAQLGIQVAVRQARAKELPRAAELINRTNQFNLNGARTTLKEVRRWADSPAHRVYVAEVGDKFGSSGVVSVCIAELREDEVQIPIMVLSCRVFGYGVELVIANQIKRELAAAHGRVVIRFEETPHNAPARAFLPKAGFAESGDAFVWSRSGDDGIAPGEDDPAWLTVDHSEA